MRILRAMPAFLVLTLVAPEARADLKCALMRSKESADRIIEIQDAGTGVAYANLNVTDAVQMARLSDAEILAYRNDLGRICRALVAANVCEKLPRPEVDDRNRTRTHRNPANREKFESAADCDRSVAWSVRTILSNFAYDSRYRR